MLVFLLLPLVALLLRIPPAQLLANLANREVAQAISLSMITTAITVLLTRAGRARRWPICWRAAGFAGARRWTR